MTPSTTSTTPLVYQWTAPEPGSVRTLDDLFALRDEMRTMLPAHPVIEIPRGVINHKVLRLTEQKTNRVESDAGGAAVHTHDWSVLLVGTGSIGITTVIIDDIRLAAQNAAVLFDDARHTRLRDLLLSRTDNPPLRSTLDTIESVLAQDQSDPAVRMQLGQSLNAIQYLLATAKDEAMPLVYPFIEEHQESLEQSTHHVHWGTECDMLLFGPGVAHCRNARGTKERGVTELYAYSMT